MYIPPVPFRSEGRVANVTKREAECDGRGSGARRGDVESGFAGCLAVAGLSRRMFGEAVLRTAKSCGPGAPWQALSSREAEKVRESDGGKCWFTGESTYKP